MGQVIYSSMLICKSVGHIPLSPEILESALKYDYRSEHLAIDNFKVAWAQTYNPRLKILPFEMYV